jgi:hypothetical protein
VGFRLSGPTQQQSFHELFTTPTPKGPA